MIKVKNKLTAAQKRAKKEAKAERKKKYRWVFMNGKQVRLERPRRIEGMSADDYVKRNADPIWLHQNEMWEYIEQNPHQKETGKSIEEKDDEPFE